MSNRGRAVAGCLSLILAGAAGPAAAKPKHEITWLLGHENLDYFEEAAETFKTAVEAGSNGDIRVRIVPEVRDQRNGLAAPEIAAKVASGEFEMGHSFCDVIGALDPRFHVFEAPYLFRDYRHLEGVFEGPLGADMLQGLRSHGLVGLSFTYSGGASGVSTAKRELKRLEDLKGLKIAVYGAPFNEGWLKSVGASAVPIGHKIREIVPGTKDGEIDGAVITWRNFQVGTLQRAHQRYNLPGSTYLVSLTYINEKFLAGLPEKYRTLIVSASREAGRIERAKTIQLNEDAKRAMLAEGVRPVYISEVEQRRVAEAVRPAVESALGRDFVEKILSAPNGPEAKVAPEALTSKAPAP
ncbi:MAG: TRAP transporter substrate-binding protein [Elusimicrobiota bacterium]|nr:TRAP transporter substrate-binding protein [Elusimicrobiota bacterium]